MVDRRLGHGVAEAIFLECNCSMPRIYVEAELKTSCVD